MKKRRRERKGQGPLGPYRVLDLAGEPGAYGAKLLAEMGADVIKVESPKGDRMRRLPPFVRGVDDRQHSLYFAYMNTNKRGITLDLQAEEGRRLFRRLVSDTDVVLETFEPGYLGSLGLDHEALMRINPGVILTSITPFGEEGPYRQWKGSELICWALSGLLNTFGDPDRPPVRPGGSLAYVAASLQAASGTLLALRARRRSGRGQRVSVSVQEACVSISSECGLPSFLDDGIQRVRMGNQRQMQAPVGHFQARDGAACFVVALPEHWDSLASWVHEATDNEEILDPLFKGGSAARVPVKEAVNHFVEQFAARYEKQYLFEEGQRRGIPITPVNTSEDIVADPHLEARDFWVEVDHRAIGRHRYPGAPFRFSRTPRAKTRPAPLLGEHNEEIFCSEAGLSRDELSRLQEARVI